MNAPESLRATASQWYERMHRDRVPEDDRACFQQWLQERPEHGPAYASIGQTWDMVRSVREHPQILALRHEMALDLTRSSTRRSTASFRVAAAAAVVAVAVGATMLLDLPGWMSGKGRYSTTIGERVVIALADDSQMTLNTQTRVRTAFSDHERRVILSDGQALFEVAKDPQRPFVVEAAGREFVAVGTAFDVRVEGKRAQVTMVEGVVKVPTATDRAEAVLIKAGEQLVIGQSSSDPAPRAIGNEGVERVISWREGRVIFEETKLSEAIAELNRYSEQKISLASPELAALRVSGAFATGKSLAFLEAVKVYYPIEVVQSDQRRIVLKSPR